MTEHLLSFSELEALLPGLPDEEFLRQLQWRKSAPRPLATAAAAGEVEKFMRRLSPPQRSRGHRAAQAHSAALLWPLWTQHAWGWSPRTQRTVELLSAIQDNQRTSGSDRSRARQLAALVEEWITGPGSPPADPFSALASLTLLSGLLPVLSPQQAFRLWKATLLLVLDVLSASNLHHPANNQHLDQRLVTAGEIPWHAGLLFEHIRGAGKLQRAGRNFLREQLEESTDTDGTPHARHLERLPLALAVYVRSLAAGERCGTPLWNRTTRDRFKQLTARALALSQPDGRLALSNGASFAPVSLLQEAAALAGNNPRESPLQLIRKLPSDMPSSGMKRRRPARHTPDRKALQTKKAVRVSSQSDWAELICMRNHRRWGTDCCVITHNELDLQMVLTALDMPLLAGACPTETHMESQLLEPKDAWECVCWFSDDDADYVELQRACADGASLLRQCLLARKDHCLLLADTLTLAEPRTLTHTLRLPLAEGATCKKDAVTRQLTLCRKGLRARVYPLALEHNRLDRAHGRLDVDRQQLVLEQTTTGRAIHVPLVIDWSPERRRDESHWRRLTVAEQGARVTPDQACGYRLQIGTRQWIFYHSLQAPRVPRTIIGQHMAYETLIGRFTAEGDVDPLVMVE